MPNPICNVCDSFEEDILHLLRDCDKARSTWELIHLDLEFDIVGVNEWISQNLARTERSHGIEWKNLFPYICHQIWVNRNKFLFEGTIHPPPEITLKRAVFAAWEVISSSINPANHTLIDNHNLPNISWNWELVSVDASFTHSLEVAGIGGCIRSKFGNWIRGFQKTIYALDALMAEIIAIIHGLQLAHQLGLDNVVILSDCQEAILRINQENVYVDAYTHVIVKCREYTKVFKEVKFVFVKREFNSVADAMAKDCRKNYLQVNELMEIPHPPMFCNDLLSLDCNGLFKP